MNKTQAKHLLNVAKSLRESTSPHFTMETFINGAYGPEEHYGITKNMCGTPACALGHYAARPDLQKLLAIRKTSTLVRVAFKGSRGTKSYMDFDDTRFHKHFGVDLKEMVVLFEHNGCGGATTPGKAAQFIERFVARKLKEEAQAKKLHARAFV